jgi:hypothetical protein
MENSDINLNKDISDMFLSDARDFLIRYKNLKESATYIGLRSKLFVELLFAVECSLKSLFFIESQLDEEKTYKKVKKLSHNIEALISSLKQESQLKFNELITIDFIYYKVFNRYLVESEIVFREDAGILGKQYYSTIANFVWMDEIYSQIHTFIDYIQAKNPFEFKSVKFSEINIELKIEKHNKLKQIISR